MEHKLSIQSLPKGVIEKTNDKKIYFTQFISLKKKVVKRYKSDGTKDFSANLSYSKYQTMYVTDLMHFYEYIKNVSQYTTITLGLTKQTIGVCKTAEAVRNGANCIYRGKEHIKYYNDVYKNDDSYSIGFLDIDFDEDAPDDFQLETEDDVRNSLISLCPLLEHCAMLIKPSSSSNIYNGMIGCYRSEGKSWHVFIIVKNHTSKTNENLKEYLLRRAWREDVNLGYVKKDKNGSVLMKSYIDMAVFSPERLIAIAKVDLDFPYVKHEVEPVFYEGGILDLNYINPDDEEDYRPKYEIQKSLIATKSANKYSHNIGENQVINLPSSESGDSIIIDNDTENKIVDIYKYLQANDYADVKVALSHLDNKVVSVYLRFLGFDVNYNFKFKLRDENTASCSINYNGFIKDFGGEFSGNIISFLMEIYGLKFIEAWNYFKSCFGKSDDISSKKVVSLPNASAFEKRITTYDNYKKDIS